ncbi:MAG: ABC transporter permease [Dongiaceae bacterium]
MHQLRKLILIRVLLGVATLFVVSLIVFLAVQLLPGDLAQQLLGQSATPENVAALRAELGLDVPAYIRYFDWLWGILHGDLGRSLAANREISEMIAPRLVNTFRLALLAAIIAIPVGISLGIAAALFRNTIFDRAITIVTLAAISLPEFFVAYILVMVLAVQLPWFPSISRISPDMTFGETIYRLILPSTTLCFAVIGYIMRLTRAAIVNVMSEPYVEMARLKGIRPWKVVIVHALPNALAPIINVVALNLAYLIVGVVIVETVFVYPGLGQLLVDSVVKRDITVVQAASLIFAGVYIIINLLADVLSIATNPRLSRSR